LLLLQTTFSFNVLLLQLGDEVVLQLDLLQALVVLGICLRSLKPILLLVFLQLMDELLQLLSLGLIALDLVLQLLQFILQSLDS